MRIEAGTDVGLVRKINEDSYDVYECGDYAYAVVADGMGGHLAGEVASAMAVEKIREYIIKNMTPELDRFQAKEVLRSAFRYANSEIFEFSKSSESVMGMGTTTTLVMLRGGWLIYAHVGDSRAYTVGKDIKQITRDHSYVQELVKLGMITPEEARVHPNRNQITRAMGVEPVVRVDSGLQRYTGRLVLICSDGLFGELEDREIKDIVTDQEPADAVRELIELAKERGGRDNITAVIIDGRVNAKEKKDAKRKGSKGDNE
ncbi:MAG: Stp1/IreP family PP2C-type Ser/Thr phosphatase [Clostridia bacterium]|nr:Stp1/IreP family PP2C-type Ser/Thr phosphatase [Clostridia bacterium]